MKKLYMIIIGILCLSVQHILASPEELAEALLNGAKSSNSLSWSGFIIPPKERANMEEKAKKELPSLMNTIVLHGRQAGSEKTLRESLQEEVWKKVQDLPDNALNSPSGEESIFLSPLVKLDSSVFLKVESNQVGEKKPSSMRGSFSVTPGQEYFKVEVTAEFPNVARVLLQAHVFSKDLKAWVAHAFQKLLDTQEGMFGIHSFEHTIPLRWSGK